MTFRVLCQGEPVLNGWTNRPASWPTNDAARAWIDYWTVSGHPACAQRFEIQEHHKDEHEQ